MRHAVNTSEVPDQLEMGREVKMEELIRCTRRAPNGELGRIDARLRSFEVRYGFPTRELGAKLDAGAIVEDEDICRWLMAAKLRARFVFATRAE
jgi:hypothetical protein